MGLMDSIVEEKIRDSIKKGEFDEFEGKGKPIKFEDLSSIPEELRMGYKMLKNAKIVPEEVQLNKEILGLQDLVNACCDEEERKKHQKRLNEKTLRFNMLMEKRKRAKSPAFQVYKGSIHNKIR